MGAAASSSSRTFFTNLYVLSTKSAVPILPAALILILKKIVTVSVRERIEYEEGNRERGREREIDTERERLTERESEREKERDTDRDRERRRAREREGERESYREREGLREIGDRR